MAKKRRKKPSGDPGSETNADSKMVNAMESDPEFFKDLLIGKRLGKCDIQKLIGEGRTSVVYRAMYEPLKRTVALKVLQQEMTKYPGVVRVFQQEGRAVAALDHENVLKIYDVGQDGSHYYLVLELLRGNDLLVLINSTEDGRLDVETALDLTAQAARGLAAAHRKNLVHRDIKPQNLVVEPSGKLKIVDFGLAAEAEGAFSGGRLGTPHYMAPEQCRGEQARTASDIYALGITLFHMLVGHAPFAGAKTTDEIVDRHLEGKRFEPEKLQPGIPRKVADLVRKMTRMDPDARPTAKEVVEAITTGTVGQDKARGGSVRARTRRRAATQGSSGAPLALIGGVLVVAAILAFVLLGNDDDPPPEKASNDPANTGPTGASDKPRKPKKPKKPEPGEASHEGLAKGLDPKLANDLRDLLSQARQEESTRNLDEAIDLYNRIRKRAPKDSGYYRLADSSYQALKKRINEVLRGKRRGSTYISARKSEKTGETFDKERAGLFKRAVNWDPTGAIARAKELREKTRKETPERLRIDDALSKLTYIERLLSIVGARAEALSGSAARWSEYDIMADGALVIASAGPNGIVLEHEDTKVKETRSWDDISFDLKIGFMDALRNPRSASETMWLGYYCQIHGDSRSEQYYDYALMLDDSPATRKSVRVLKEDAAAAKPATPKKAD